MKIYLIYFKTNDKFEISGAKFVDFWYENIKNYDFEKSDAKGDLLILPKLYIKQVLN